MAHAYTTKRGKNKKAKLGVRKDQQQNQERSLKNGPANLQQFLYDGPKESTIGVIGRIGCSSSSSQARLENVKSRLQKALVDKCSNPECTNSQEGATLSECAACRSVRYCSRDCQLAHWSAHKEQCKIIKKKLQEEEQERQRKVMEALKELSVQESTGTGEGTTLAEAGAESTEDTKVAIVATNNDSESEDSSDEDVEDINDIN